MRQVQWHDVGRREGNRAGQNDPERRHVIRRSGRDRDGQSECSGRRCRCTDEANLPRPRLSVDTHSHVFAYQLELYQLLEYQLELYQLLVYQLDEYQLLEYQLDEYQLLEYQLDEY